MLLALEKEMEAARTKLSAAEARRGALETILAQMESTVKAGEAKVSGLSKQEGALQSQLEEARRELQELHDKATAARKSAPTGQSPPEDWESLSASIADMLSPAAFDSLSDPARQLHWALHLIEHVDALDGFFATQPTEVSPLRDQVTEALARVQVYEFTLEAGAAFDETMEHLATAIGASTTG